MLRFVLTLLAIPVVGQAALVWGDYHTAGDNLLVTDTLSGKTFISLNATMFKTIPGALSENPGYHLATDADLFEIFANNGGGFTALDGVNRLGSDAQTALTFMTYFGFWWDTGFDRMIYVEVFNTPTTYKSYWVDYRYGAASFPGGASQLMLTNDNHTAASSSGVLLVRDTPEPASGLLLAAGLGGVLAWRRRRRR